MKTDIRVIGQPDRHITDLMHVLVERGIPAGSREIYRGRNIIAVTPDGKLCIKAFGVPGTIKGLIYGTMRQPKAQKAYNNAIRLRTLGVNTPEPVGMVVNTDSGRLGRSYYVCRYVPGFHNLRDVEKRPDFPALARALAQFMLMLHRKGVYMKDFTPGNILFKESRGSYAMMLVDINRMEFGITQRQLLLSNFRALLFDRDAVAEVARNYAELACEPHPADFVRQMLRIYDRHQAALHRHRKFKKALGK